MQSWHHHSQRTVETILLLEMPCSIVTNSTKSHGKKGLELNLPLRESAFHPPQANFKTNLLNTMEIFFHLPPEIPYIDLE